MFSSGFILSEKKVYGLKPTFTTSVSAGKPLAGIVLLSILLFWSCIKSRSAALDEMSSFGIAPTFVSMITPSG